MRSRRPVRQAWAVPADLRRGPDPRKTAVLAAPVAGPGDRTGDGLRRPRPVVGAEPAAAATVRCSE